MSLHNTTVISSLHSHPIAVLRYFCIEKHLIRDESAALIFIKNHSPDASSTGFVMNSFSSININTFICVNRRFEAEWIEPYTTLSCSQKQTTFMNHADFIIMGLHGILEHAKLFFVAESFDAMQKYFIKISLTKLFMALALQGICNLKTVQIATKVLMSLQ